MVSRSILPLFAHYQGGEFQMVGVGWIVATFGQTAVMLTAKHVFDEVVQKSTHPRSHSTALKEFLPAPPPQRHHKASIYALWPLPDGTTETLAIMASAWHGKDFDVSACCVCLRDNAPKDLVFSDRFAIDSSPQKIGTPVAVIGFTNIKFDCTVDNATKTMVANISYKSEARHGMITEVYKQQGTSCPHPGFRTNISIDSGMSGSPVFSKADPKSWKVCGIASKDISTESSNMVKGSGESFVSELWPAMRIALPTDLSGAKRDAKKISLLEMERLRQIDDIARASEHLFETEDKSASLDFHGAEFP